VPPPRPPLLEFGSSPPFSHLVCDPPPPPPPAAVFCSAGLGDIILWRREGCKRLASLRCGHLEALGLSWRPADSLLAAGSHAGAVNFFRVAESEEAEGAFSLALSHTVHRGGSGAAAATAVMATAFSRDGVRCAAAHADGCVSVVDVDTRAVVAVLAPLGAALPLRSLAFFGSDGERLAAGGDDARVSLRWVGGGGGGGGGVADAVFAAHTGFVTGVAAHGGLLASASADRTALLWDPRRRGPIAVVEGIHNDKVNAVSFSPDGTLLASVSEGGVVAVSKVPFVA
jgi:hypothetical protein